MRKFLLSIMMLACQTLAFADGSALLITFNDGTTTSYVLSEKPRVTFSEGNMLIQASDASAQYARADVSRFTFVDAGEASIKNLKQGSIAFEYHDNIIRLAGAQIEVFATNGTLVKKGSGNVSLEDLSDGVYAVKFKNQTIKVIKK